MKKKKHPKLRAVMSMYLLGWLVAVPLYGADQPQALGHVLSGPEGVYVDGIVVPSGTTLFDGDSIRAYKSPAILNLSNQSRVELAENSGVSLQGDARSTTLSNVSGRAKFQFPASATVSIRTPEITINSATTGSTFAGEVSITGQTVKFVSERGEFSIRSNNQPVRLVKEGEVAQLEANSPVQEPQLTAPPKATPAVAKAGSKGGLFGMSKGATAALLIGAAAAGIVPLAAAGGGGGGGGRPQDVSPSR